MTATSAPSLRRLALAEVAVCPLCDQIGCRSGHPDPIHFASYPFLPGGVDPLADTETIVAPYRVWDHEKGVLAYGAGDQVPIVDAIRFGLVLKASGGPVAAPEDEPKPRTTKKTPARTRARQKPQETR